MFTHETKMGWTDERVELMKKLWTVDGLSTSKIAAELGGVTRNAVIGKLHRLGMTNSDTPRIPKVRLTNAQPKHRRHRSKFRATLTTAEDGTKQVDMPKKLAYMPPLPPAPPDASNYCDMFALTSATCRWPMWATDADPRLYCGTATAGGGEAYCRYHKKCGTQLAYVRPTHRPFRDGSRAHP